MKRMIYIFLVFCVGVCCGSFVIYHLDNTIYAQEDVDRMTEKIEKIDSLECNFQKDYMVDSILMYRMLGDEFTIEKCKENLETKYDKEIFRYICKLYENPILWTTS